MVVPAMLISSSRSSRVSHGTCFIASHTTLPWVKPAFLRFGSVEAAAMLVLAVALLLQFSIASSRSAALPSYCDTFSHCERFDSENAPTTPSTSCCEAWHELMFMLLILAS